MIPKVFVAGGTGRLGLMICKMAVTRGLAKDVVSLSRSGYPSAHYEDWMEKVKWLKGDVSCPHTYEKNLIDANLVVHSVGILFESDYKPLLHSPSVLDATNKLKKKLSTLGHEQSPFDRNPGFARKVTYDDVHRLGAIILAKTACAGPSKTFVYISAHGPLPFHDPEYFDSKLRAESGINELKNLRSVFLRPGFMYSKEYPLTSTLGHFIETGTLVSKSLGSAVGGDVGKWLSNLSGGSIPFESVALAALACEKNKTLAGIVSHNELFELSHKV